ncbi:MAG TPA: putative metalloprotease CJM1_0395 family protein [Polyangia bacterium]
MRIGSRDNNVWSDYGGSRVARRTSDFETSEANGAARTTPVLDRAGDRRVDSAEGRDERPVPALEPLGQRDPEPLWVRQSAPRDPASAETDAEAGLGEESEANGKTGLAAKEEPTRRGPGRPLTKEQEAEVQALRQRDTEVRAHEAAHMAAAGATGGGASFDYKIGPDGRHYAVGGEVPVRTAPAKTPEEAIRNAAQLRAAALAPAQPSAQDRAVAAEAAAMEAAARAELAARRTEDSLRAAEIAISTASPAPTTTTDGNDAEGGAAKAVVAEVQSAEVNERERMLQRLESEQRYQRGGWRHLHSDSGCGSCSSAIASYR